MIKQARQSRCPTPRRLADQVSKEDGTVISPQYLFEIEVHHRVLAPRVLQGIAQVLALAAAADVVVREYV
jgi:hypothetical protein